MTRPTDQLLGKGINRLHGTFVLWDAEDRLILCNERFKEVNRAVADLLHPGITYEEFLRAGVARGSYPEAAGREDEWIAERMRRHRDPSGLFEMEREDGLWLQIDEQKMPDGGIIGMASDITSVKLAEKALRASETRFRQHASATSDWLWEIDAERRYTFISDVMEDQVGRSPSQYLGTTVDQTIDKLYNRAEWQPFLDAFEA
ncbi:MAG: PAS-domain containing protein, partial [Alphaproteobacteria bacterium]